MIVVLIFFFLLSHISTTPCLAGVQARPDPFKILKELPPPQVIYPPATSTDGGLYNRQARNLPAPRILPPLALPNNPFPSKIKTNKIATDSKNVSPKNVIGSASVNKPASFTAKQTGTASANIASPERKIPSEFKNAAHSIIASSMPVIKDTSKKTSDAGKIKTVKVEQPKAVSPTIVPHIASSPIAAKKPVVATSSSKIAQGSATVLFSESHPIGTASTAVTSNPTSDTPPIASDTTDADLQDEPPLSAAAAVTLEKAKSLKAEMKWSELVSLFQDNPSIAETREGAELRIDALLNSAKVNYASVKSAADAIIEKDPKNPIGHFALAHYYLYSKKPDLDKALISISKACSASKPPPGAATLYWTATFKKRWLILVVILGAIVIGVDKMRKKIKARKESLQVLQGLEPLGAPASSESLQVEPVKSLSKASLKEKLLEIRDLVLSKLRRKTADTPPMENVLPEIITDTTQDLSVPDELPNASTETELPQEIQEELTSEMLEEATAQPKENAEEPPDDPSQEPPTP